MPIVLSDAFRVRALLTPELTSLIAEKVAALRTEAGLATILDGIGEGFYAVDRDWRIILFNRRRRSTSAARPPRCSAASCGRRFPARARPRSADCS